MASIVSSVLDTTLFVPRALTSAELAAYASRPQPAS
jgi:hypothetical protein